MMGAPEVRRVRPPVRKVLIVRLSALGDVVHVLPVLDALRRALPKAAIAWLVEEKAASLLAGHPQLDRVFVLPRDRAFRALVRERRPLASLRTLRTFFRDLRRERFDVAIDFQGNFRSGLATYLSGARARIGFARGFCKEGNHVFTTHRVAPESRRIHKVDTNLRLLRPLGVEPLQDGAAGATAAGAAAAPRAVVAIPEEARRRVEGFIRSLDLDPGTPLVALVPAVSRFGAFKQWHPERFAALADALAEDQGARSILTWGPGERPIAAKVASLAAERTRPIIACETSSVLELAAIFERCDAVVGCDTGPLHLAAALGVPVVGLYGMKDPAIYGPRGSGPAPTDVIYKAVHCSPCKLRWCGNVICMDAIQVDDVEAAVARVLAGSGTGPGAS